MSGELRLWWDGRSSRERLLLLVMFALLAFVLVWLLVIRPLGDAFDAAKARHDAAVIALAEARARTGGPAGTAIIPPLPIDSLISRTASEAGFAGARIDTRSPREVNVIIDAGRPQALFGWVNMLEAQGVIAQTLRARANADRTLYVEIAFRAGGAL